MKQLDDIHTALAAFTFRDKRLRPAEPPREFVLAQARRFAGCRQCLSQSQIRSGVCGFSHARQAVGACEADPYFGLSQNGFNAVASLAGPSQPASMGRKQRVIMFSPVRKW